MYLANQFTHFLPIRLVIVVCSWHFSYSSNCLFTVVPHCDVTETHCNATETHCEVTETHCDATETHCDVTEMHCDVTETHCDVTETHYDVTEMHCDVTETESAVISGSVLTTGSVIQPTAVFIRLECFFSWNDLTMTSAQQLMSQERPAASIMLLAIATWWRPGS